MSGGGSFTSDQSVAHATATAQMVALNRRARLTSIQGKGNSTNGSIIFKLVVLQARLLLLTFLVKKV